jgi:hypothetical protein
MRHALVFGIIIAIFVIFILTPTPVRAHSPSSINLDFEYDSQVLTVVIRHSVSNPNSHYVFLIEIWKNDVSITTRSYDSQTNSSTQMDTFDISEEDGDVLRVKGDCNQGGSITGQITVSTSDTTTSGEPTITTSDGLDNLSIWILFGSVGIVILIVAVICLRKR